MTVFRPPLAGASKLVVSSVKGFRTHSFSLRSADGLLADVTVALHRQIGRQAGTESRHTGGLSQKFRRDPPDRLPISLMLPGLCQSEI